MQNLDINECVDENLNSCEQLCNNTAAAHNCLCFDGYELNIDGYSCSGLKRVQRSDSNMHILYSGKFSRDSIFVDR